MATNVTVKGQVTLPKAIREAAGIHPGDRVNVRARAEGGIIVERETALAQADAYRDRLKEIARRRPMREGPFGVMASDEIMQLLRGED